MDQYTKRLLEVDPNFFHRLFLENVRHIGGKFFSVSDERHQREILTQFLALPPEYGVDPAANNNEALGYAATHEDVWLVKKLLELPPRAGIYISPWLLHVMKNRMPDATTLTILEEDTPQRRQQRLVGIIARPRNEGLRFLFSNLVDKEGNLVFEAVPLPYYDGEKRELASQCSQVLGYLDDDGAGGSGDAVLQSLRDRSQDIERRLLAATIPYSEIRRSLDLALRHEAIARGDFIDYESGEEIRGSNSVSPGLTQEVERLQDQKTELRENYQAINKEKVEFNAEFGAALREGVAKEEEAAQRGLPTLDVWRESPSHFIFVVNDEDILCYDVEMLLDQIGNWKTWMLECTAEGYAPLTEDQIKYGVGPYGRDKPMNEVDTQHIYVSIPIGEDHLGYVALNQIRTLLGLLGQGYQTFCLTNEHSFPYTISARNVAGIPNFYDPGWVSANHCQGGSAIIVYDIEVLDQSEERLALIKANKEDVGPEIDPKDAIVGGRYSFMLVGRHGKPLNAVYRKHGENRTNNPATVENKFIGTFRGDDVSSSVIYIDLDGLDPGKHEGEYYRIPYDQISSMRKISGGGKTVVMPSYANDDDLRENVLDVNDDEARSEDWLNFDLNSLSSVNINTGKREEDMLMTTIMDKVMAASPNERVLFYQIFEQIPKQVRWPTKPSAEFTDSLSRLPTLAPYILALWDDRNLRRKLFVQRERLIRVVDIIDRAEKTDDIMMTKKFIEAVQEPTPSEMGEMIDAMCKEVVSGSCSQYMRDSIRAILRHYRFDLAKTLQALEKAKEDPVPPLYTWIDVLHEQLGTEPEDHEIAAIPYESLGIPDDLIPSLTYLRGDETAQALFFDELNARIDRTVDFWDRVNKIEDEDEVDWSEDEDDDIPQSLQEGDEIQEH